MKSTTKKLGPADKKPRLVTNPTKEAKSDKHKAHKAPARSTGYSKGGCVVKNTCSPKAVSAGASYTGSGRKK